MSKPNPQNLFSIKVKSNIYDLSIGDNLIFDMSLKPKENRLAMIQNSDNSTLLVKLHKNSKNKLVGINNDGIEVSIQRILGIATCVIPLREFN